MGRGPCDPFPNGRVYWLSVSAIYGPDQQVLYPWGWNTRQPEWNDDAVLTGAINDPTGQPLPWPPTGPFVGCTWVSGSPIEVPLEPGGDPISWDVAFELTTNEPKSPGNPDLNFDGFVNFLDFAILANKWLSPVP